MGFNKGKSAIEQGEADAQAARRAASSRLDYFRLKDSGDVGFLRFITPAEEWLQVAQHSGIVTKAAPATAKSWPKQMDGICRYDKQIQDEIGTTDCYICDQKLVSSFRAEFSKPAPRMWAVAAERKAIMDGSRVIGMADVTEEYDILDADGKSTNKKGTRPKLLMVNMAWNNFFRAIGAVEDTHGDIRRRDFKIIRTGTSTDTKYTSVTMDPTPDLHPEAPEWSRYTDVLESRGITVEKIILERAGDEWYARWFDVRKTINEKGEVVLTGTTTPTSATPAASALSVTDEDEAAKIAAIRARITG